MKRLVLDPIDDRTVQYTPGRRTAEQSARRRRIARRPDRARQAVLLRIVGAALRAPIERLPVRAQRVRHDRAEADVQQRLRQGQLRPDESPAHQLLGLVDANHVDGDAPGVQRLARELDLELQDVEPGPEDPRLRDPADQLRRHAGFHAEQLVAHQCSRADTSTTTTRIPACQLSAASRTRPAQSASAIRLPADQIGGVGFQNTPRVQLAFEDHTKRGYVQADFIKAFTAAGSHNFKGGVGFQHTANDVNVAYPGGGYVWVYWDSAFTSNDTGRTDRGQYGYYEVDDIGTPGEGVGRYLVALRTGPVDDPQPDAEPRSPHRARGDSVVPQGHPGDRVRVRLRRQARSASRRQLRRVQRRPAEVVRQLGPVLRLDQVRSVARGVRRRRLARPLPVARHDGRLLAVRARTCLVGTSGTTSPTASRTSGSRTSTASIRTSSR